MKNKAEKKWEWKVTSIDEIGWFEVNWSDENVDTRVIRYRSIIELQFEPLEVEIARNKTPQSGSTEERRKKFSRKVKNCESPRIHLPHWLQHTHPLNRLAFLAVYTLYTHPEKKQWKVSWTKSRSSNNNACLQPKTTRKTNNNAKLLFTKNAK